MGGVEESPSNLNMRVKMTATLEEIKKETNEINAEREELQKLINDKKKKIKTEKKKSSAKKQANKEEEENKDMIDWVEGVFIFRDQPGQILPFNYKGQPIAIKDGEICQMPLEIADHLNSLKLQEHEWVRDGKDENIGQQGTKKKKNVIPRTEFRITRHFKQHKSIKMKKPERHQR